MSKRILEGIKVADFSWVAAGPTVTRELAAHGATVVKIESHKRLDALRVGGPFKTKVPDPDGSAMFLAINYNKLGMSLDLNHPKGREIGRRIALWADVVADGMVPGVMKKWSLDYENLSKEKPGLVYFSTTQQGQYGPYATFGGYGSLSAALGGFPHMVGLPDREPLNLLNNYTDVIAPWYLVLAIVGALRLRNKTGKGAYLDQAQVEAGISFLGPSVLECQANGRVPIRDGNRDPYRAPHNVYPCQGSDRWVAIEVANGQQWEAFCQVIGSPAWTSEERFSTLAGRKANEDELNRLVSDWTAKQTAEDIMVKLQAAGVSAGIVEAAEDLFKDRQLAHRQHFKVLEHPVGQSHSCHMPAYRMSQTPAEPTSPAPCLGQDNEYVYRELLGVSEDEMAQLLAEGVITTRADLPQVARKK